MCTCSITYPAFQCCSVLRQKQADADDDDEDGEIFLALSKLNLASYSTVTRSFVVRLW